MEHDRALERLLSRPWSYHAESLISTNTKPHFQRIYIAFSSPLSEAVTQQETVLDYISRENRLRIFSKSDEPKIIYNLQALYTNTF